MAHRPKASEATKGGKVIAGSSLMSDHKGKCKVIPSDEDNNLQTTETPMKSRCTAGTSGDNKSLRKNLTVVMNLG